MTVAGFELDPSTLVGMVAIAGLVLALALCRAAARGDRK